MDATVAIPWRPTPDRVPAFKRCLEFWINHNFPVVTADSDPTLPFHCNIARNNAIAKATTDIIISADGDTLPEDIAQVHEAIKIVSESPETVVWPFTTYVYVFGWEVNNPDLSTARVVHAIDNMSAGIVVFHKDTYADLGGYDENFQLGAWGYDDLAFHHCAETLTTTRRLPGRVFSFDHEVNRDTSEENPNRRRYEELYAPARGNPGLMRAIPKRRQ